MRFLSTPKRLVCEFAAGLLSFYIFGPILDSEECPDTLATISRSRAPRIGQRGRLTGDDNAESVQDKFTYEASSQKS